jgi:Zn-dependent peptidase ImmA (M78 family)
MTVRVDVAPPLLAWAVERSGLEHDALEHRFPKLREWEEGARSPTFRQLEDFARATRTPLGYLLLDAPPVEQVPIPDFRTQRDTGVRRPSPELLDTIALCRERQEWFRVHARASGQPSLTFVGSLDTEMNPAVAADVMRDAVGFGLQERQRHGTWEDALRALVSAVEDSGVLVMTSGIVGANTHRVLDPDEFRGFALVDELAPVIFINGADAKAAQIFTLAHELVHLWLGQSALDDPRLGEQPVDGPERWCNQVAAELLVPTASLRDRFDGARPLDQQVEEFRRLYRVSGLVVLHSLFDARLIAWDAFMAAYGEELDRIEARTQDRSGGDFYRTLPVRVSHRFARAVLTSVAEGETLYRDAYRMLGVRKHETFEQLRDRVGVG